MNKDEALRLALEALQSGDYWKGVEAVNAIKQALANEALDRMADNERELGIQMQPEPEPVAWMNKHGACMSAVFKQVDETAGEYTTPLYTSPPKREPLTDAEIKRMAAPLFMSHYWGMCNEFARAIESAHGIKE